MVNADLKKLRLAIEANEKLYSVFERITLGNAQPKLNNCHDARVLSYQNIVHVGENFSSEQLMVDLQAEFETDVETFEKLPESAQNDTLPFLFQKYGWRIGDPARTEDNQLAVTYCDAYRLEKIFESAAQEFILLKGDLAGIQNYIYGNIQPKQAGGLRDIAKKLRGRSLIVSLLTDFLAGVMLRELGLSSWHLLFAGGGHFNLLLPKTAETPALLKVLSEDLDFQMRRRFGENLQLVVAHLEFSKNDIEKNPSECFSKLISQLERQKQQTHKKYLHDHFFPEEKMTAEEMKKRRKEIDDWEIDIGERLPKKDFLVETVTTKPVFRTRKLPEIVTFEMHRHCYSLLVPENFKNAKTMLSESEDLVSAQVLSINDTEFLKHAGHFQNSKISFGFRFLGKTLPMIFDEKKQREVPKTFEEIVKEGNDENKLLAALRLDVDDLGFIFSRGMPGASLGEILTLSREMQYFFSAHFNKLAEKHNLYLIYSGGDDAFAVGKWDNTIAFLRELRYDFQKFVFDNSTKERKGLSDVHFSAGIFMGNPHYPVGRFYRDAGKLQDDAKNSNERKNRVKIFNQILVCEEFDSKINLGEKFALVFEGEEKEMKKLPSAFAYRILNLVKSSFRESTYEDREGNWYNRGSINPERFSRNVAGLRYFLARQGFDKKRSEEAVSVIEKELIWDFMRSFDFNGDEDKIYPVRDYLVALNYAIFKNRAKASQKS
jgi:CRISPR-associated protein Csm1